MIKKIETKPRACRYLASCRRLAALAALLSAANYCIILPDALYRTPYFLCIAAAIGLLAGLLFPENLSPVQKCFPLVLKVCSCFVSTNLLISQGSAFTTTGILALITWALRGVASCAVLANAYCFSTEGSTGFGYRCWRGFVRMNYTGFIADGFLFMYLVATLDPNGIAGAGPFELIGRWIGEFFFSAASFLCLCPDFVTINVRKFRRLARQYLAIAALASLYVGVCGLVFHAWDSWPHGILLGSAVSCEATFFIQVLLSWLPRRACRNHLREYCEEHWYYTFADVMTVNLLLKQLADIRREIAACRASGGARACLDSLRAEASYIKCELSITYGLNMEEPVSRRPRRPR